MAVWRRQREKDNPVRLIKKEIMRLIVHGTKYIQGSRKAKVTPGKESVVSRNSNGEGSKIEGRT